MTDELNLTARELAALIRKRQVSPVEVVQAALDRIEAHRDLNAFITVTADAALVAAHAAEQAVLRGADLGPLHGVPWSAKDLILTAGVRTTMGSAIYEDFVPDRDALAVARTQAAGGILIGKTTTPEFGAKQSTDAPLFGRTLNPLDPTVTCGASSGGAAVAVAAGLGALALGTDGGGSIRIPASCCGVVGLKGTLGSIAYLQPADRFAANSYVGPMTRDVADLRLFHTVLKGYDRRDPWGQAGVLAEIGAGRRLDTRRGLEAVRGLRVAYLPTAGNPVDPQVRRATDAVAARLQEAGAVVETIQLDFVSLEPHFIVLLESLTAARVLPHLQAYRNRLDPALVRLVERGLLHSAVDLHRAQAARTQCFEQLQAVFDAHDVLLSPTVSAPPLPISIDPNGIVPIDGQPAGTIRGAWYPYTYPMNLSGHPALSMPCGKTADGLPIGMQLAGPWYADEALMDLALLLEDELRSSI